MVGTMALRSGYPALRAETFARLPSASGADVMTVGSTVNNTAFSLAILVVGTTFVWNRAPQIRQLAPSSRWEHCASWSSPMLPSSSTRGRSSPTVSVTDGIHAVGPDRIGHALDIAQRPAPFFEHTSGLRCRVLETLQFFGRTVPSVASTRSSSRRPEFVKHRYAIAPPRSAPRHAAESGSRAFDISLILSSQPFSALKPRGGVSAASLIKCRRSRPSPAIHLAPQTDERSGQAFGHQVVTIARSYLLTDKRGNAGLLVSCRIDAGYGAARTPRAVPLVLEAEPAAFFRNVR